MHHPARAGSVLTVVVSLLLLGGTLPASAAPTWSAPVRATGTAGWPEARSAIAADGTIVIVRTVDAGGTQLRMEARVRAPGARRFVRVPGGPEGRSLLVTAMLATPGGDAWVSAVTDNPAGVASMKLWRIDTGALRWVRAGRPFAGSVEQDYSIEGPMLSRSADGTLTVVATAAPRTPPAGEPVYRVAVATGRPDGRFTTRFLTPADLHAIPLGITSNARGEVAIPMVTGFATAAMTPRLAVRGTTGRWRVLALGPAGSSQKVTAAIGSDGTIGVVWLSPANPPWTEVTLGILGPTCGRTSAATACVDMRAVAAGGDAKDQPAVAVEVDGDVLAGWVQADGVASRIWLYHAGEDAPTVGPVSDGGLDARLSGLVPAGGSRVGMIGVLFTTALSGLGLRYWPIRDGVAGSAAEITGAEVTEGAVNSETLAFPKGLGVIVWTRGAPPATDVAVAAQRR